MGGWGVTAERSGVGGCGKKLGGSYGRTLTVHASLSFTVRNAGLAPFRVNPPDVLPCPPCAVIANLLPSPCPPTPHPQRAAAYIEDLIPSVRKAIAKAEQPPKAKKGAPAEVRKEGGNGASVLPCRGSKDEAAAVLVSFRAKTTWMLRRTASPAPHTTAVLIYEMCAASHTRNLPGPCTHTLLCPQAPGKVSGVHVFVSERFVGWQERVLCALAPAFDAKTRTFAPDAQAAVLEAAKQVRLMGAVSVWWCGGTRRTRGNRCRDGCLGRGSCTCGRGVGDEAGAAAGCAHVQGRTLKLIWSRRVRTQDPVGTFITSCAKQKESVVPFLLGLNPYSSPRSHLPPQDAGLASLPDKQLKQTVMPFSKFKMEEAANAGAQVGMACRGQWQTRVAGREPQGGWPGARELYTWPPHCGRELCKR